VGSPVHLALVGPTASGKTEAAVEIAEVLSAEIGSVDSMLVYRGMDVGTAKPTADQRARVRHHLLDLVDPAEPFSVALFQHLARGALADIAARGRRSLLVGGGGLYYRAIVDGLEFPGTDALTRRLLDTEAGVLGRSDLHARLASMDPPAAARIEPGNVRRTVRALEVAAITGRPFSSYAEVWERYPAGAVRAAGVAVDRPMLRRRIERRVEGMMPKLLGETRKLVERGFGQFLTSSQAIGYAEAVACLEGRVSEAEAAAATVRRTKALARRQLAWLRRDPRIRWFPAGEEGAPAVAGDIMAYLLGGPGTVDGAGERFARSPAARAGAEA
jgi:tRNA dimethylallyltransferase